MLADGFTRKNLRRHNFELKKMVFTVFRFVLLLTGLFTSTWRYTFIARQADRRAITGTEFYTHKEMTIEIYANLVNFEVYLKVPIS